MDKKGFKRYREGIKRARNVFSRNIMLYFKYWIFLLTGLVSKASIVLSPLSTLGHFNIVEELKEGNDVTLEKITSDLNNKTKYWNSVLLFAIKILVLAAGLFIIGSITYVFGYIGFILDPLTGFSFYLLAVLFSIPGGILALIYLLKIEALFEMASYIAKQDDKLTVSEILAKSNKLITKQSIFTMFVVYFINILLLLIVASIFTYFIVIFSNGYDYISSIIVVAILAFIFLMFLTNRLLAMKISIVNLFSDLLKQENNKYSLANESDELKEKERQLVALFESETGGL